MYRLPISTSATNDQLISVSVWHENQVKFQKHQPERHKDEASLQRSAQVVVDVEHELIARALKV